MNTVAAIMAVFSVIGALDRMIGNRFGLGKEFEKGFMLFGSLALSMIGMIVMSPLIADALQPAMATLWNTLHVDPSLVMASLFANDLGGASLAVETAIEPVLGRFNGLVESCMMGATLSFTIPYSLAGHDDEWGEDQLTTGIGAHLPLEMRERGGSSRNLQERVWHYA